MPFRQDHRMPRHIPLPAAWYFNEPSWDDHAVNGGSKHPEETVKVLAHSVLEYADSVAIERHQYWFPSLQLCILEDT